MSFFDDHVLTSVFYKRGGQIAQNILEAGGLRHMDFLKYSGEVVEADETARHSPSGLRSGFSGHPCPEISGYRTEY